MSIMSLRVLQNRSENLAARQTLIHRRLSMLPPLWRIRLRQLLRRPDGPVGDLRKSWDVLGAADLIAASLRSDDPILDLGAYRSEILCVLHRMGMTDLTGIDLDPRITQGPYSDRIRYVVGDFMDTPFNDASFAAITAISVIEHGYKPQRLLAEVARLLRPGGLFICSTDYWPQKIDTSGIEIYGMPWQVFSEDDLREFIQKASSHGLEPMGDLCFEASKPTIHHADRDFTFAIVAMQRHLDGATA